MNSKWTVISFQHKNNRVSYTWTHSAVNITTELTPEQLAQAVTWAENNGVWFHQGQTLFLCANATQQTAMTNALDGLGYEYDVEASDLTAEDRTIIEKAQISNRNEIAELLDVPKSIHWATVTAVDTGAARGITVQRGGRTVVCYGTLVPDVGDKVLVAFADGDADKPCVIGKVLGI